METHAQLLAEENQENTITHSYSKQLTRKSLEIEENLVLFSTVVGINQVSKLLSSKRDAEDQDVSDFTS